MDANSAITSEANACLRSFWHWYIRPYFGTGWFGKRGQMSFSQNSISQLVADGQIRFTTALYWAVRRTYDDKVNINVLPMAVVMDLLQLSVGVGQRTAEEIRVALGLPTLDAETLEREWRRLNARLETTKKKAIGSKVKCVMESFSDDHKQAIVLSCLLKELQASSVSSKTRMMVDRGQPLTQQLARVCDLYFDTKIDVVDFDKVESKVNKERHRRPPHKTQLVSFRPIQGQDQVTEPDFEAEEEQPYKLGLTSHAFFQTTWTIAFKRSKTAREMFYVNDTTCRKVKMMHTTAQFRVGQLRQLDARMIEIPLAGCRQAMYVLLPNKMDGLAHLEHALFRGKVLNEWKAFESSLSAQTVHVALPKFKDRTVVDVYDVLPHMTVNRLSNQELSDCSLNSNTSDLHVTHHTIASCVKINEKGLKAPMTKSQRKAFCATGKMAQAFLVCYPFLFIVSHRQNQSIVSVGRVVAPPLAVKNRRDDYSVHKQKKHAL